MALITASRSAASGTGRRSSRCVPLYEMPARKYLVSSKSSVLSTWVNRSPVITSWYNKSESVRKNPIFTHAPVVNFSGSAWNSSVAARFR